MAGIVASLPSMVITAFETLIDFGTTNSIIAGSAEFLLFIS